jgi:hypothetical protein
MITTIKKGWDKNHNEKLLNKELETKGVNTKKYCGVIKLKEDTLVIQKHLRIEWG